MMENGQGTGSKLALPPLTPEQQEALQRVMFHSVLYADADVKKTFLILVHLL